jgi:type III effector protein AvrRps4
MHHISFSSGNSSFNYTTPVQEAQNRASAPANSPPPATPTSIAQASGGQQRPVAMPSMQARLLRLRQAVDAQRQDINTQAGPSNNPHLNALNHLEQRDFEPAAGGIEIPFTPNSLLGGGRSKRVDADASSSRGNMRVCPPGAGIGLEDAIAAQKVQINRLQQRVFNIETGREVLPNGTDLAEALNQARRMVRLASEELESLESRMEAFDSEYRRING